MEQTASDHEAIMEEYQLRMDEMKEDLNSRRKEEKELKGKERAYLIQIQSVSFFHSCAPHSFLPCLEKRGSKIGMCLECFHLVRVGHHQASYDDRAQQDGV
jgi:hypothetical protein